MEIDDDGGKHSVKGGKTILGRVFSYQEKTGMSIENIMKLPYIFFVLGMADAPWIDYDSKKEKEKVNRPTTVEEELAALTGM